MSYGLSFAEDFFTGNTDGIGEVDIRELYPVSKRPQCVVQALVSMEAHQPGEFRRMVKKALGYSLTKGQPADETVFYELLEAVRKYDRCDSLKSPIEVYVCAGGYYVTVYEDIEEEVA
jgi:hypothetical protein